MINGEILTKIIMDERVEKKSHRVEKRGLKMGKITSRDIVTKTEKEILMLLTKKKLSVKEIAEQRGVTNKAIYKTLSRLRKKGYPIKHFLRGLKTKGMAPTFSTLSFGQKAKHSIRLHGQKIKGIIFWKSPLYDKIRKFNNILTFEKQSIILHKKTILIHSNLSFYGKNEDIAKSLSVEFWKKFIVRIQEKYNCLILTAKKGRFHIYQAHYSEINNGLAKEYNSKKQKLVLYDQEDHKEWLKIDNSFNLNELEAVHPDKAHEDIGIIRGFFEDLRKEQCYKLSEITNLIGVMLRLQKTTIEIQNDQARALKVVLDLLVSNLPQQTHKVKENTEIPEYIN